MKTVVGVLLETLCCHEALRRCGFEASDIFVQLAKTADASQALLDNDAPTGTLFVHVVLKAQCREFTITVREWTDSDAAFAKRWGEAVTWFNNASQSTVRPIWDASTISHRMVKLVTALTIKGFALKSLGAASPTRSTTLN